MSAAPDALLAQSHPHQAAAARPAWLARAAREGLGYAGFPGGRREEETAARAVAETQRRLRQAAFPFAASIEQFDFRARPELKRQGVLRYLDATFVEQAGTLTLIGPPGPGKAMLAICVATKQVQRGDTARFVTAQARAAQRGRTATVAGRQRLLKPLRTRDVLVLDERGDPPTEPAFGPALCEIVAGRYTRRPAIITSNKSLTEWAGIVQDVSLAAALVDRRMDRGQVFYLKGPSWRTRDRLAAGATTPEAAAEAYHFYFGTLPTCISALTVVARRPWLPRTIPRRDSLPTGCLDQRRERRILHRALSDDLLDEGLLIGHATIPCEAYQASTTDADQC